MIVARTSMVSGVLHEMDLPITEEQIAAYNQGTLVQNAFPQLNADQREFMLTGITPDEWQAIFGEEE